MHVARMQRLVSLLEQEKARPTVQFNMATWGLRFDLSDYLKQVLTGGGFCRTAACAIGVACHDSVFQSQGLKPTWERDGFMRPTFGGVFDFSAVALFFNISSGEAEDLFHPHAYPAGERAGAAALDAVIARLRDMLEADEQDREMLYKRVDELEPAA